MIRHCWSKPKENLFWESKLAKAPQSPPSYHLRSLLDARCFKKPCESPLISTQFEQMSHVSISDIISVKMRRENWCRIDTWLETPVTRNINTLWQSNAVLCYYARDCGLRLCGLTAVGAYIHPAASSPKGGENVIYTLIMPAPLNTPLARCNILDISTSLPLPLSPSFSPFHINPHTSWAPCWYLLSSSWIQSSTSADVLLWSVCIFMYVCSICTTPRLCQLLSLFFFFLCLNHLIKMHPQSIYSHYCFM